MLNWFHALPSWLVWLLLSPLIALGLGLFWVMVLAGNEGGSREMLPTWREMRGKSWLLELAKVALIVMVFGVVLTAILGLFFLPMLFYRRVLGWPFDDALRASPFTTIGIMVAGAGVCEWIGKMRACWRERESGTKE